MSHNDDISLKELQEKFGFSQSGLNQETANQRLSQYGKNEIAEKKSHPLLKFLRYFWGPIPIMIEAAAILSLVVGDMRDFIIICALLLINGLIGFWEEFKAGNAIKALKESLALTAKVKRDGKWGSIAATDLVPGDIIRLRIGDIVPADCKILDKSEMQVDQSALTGESLPVTKHYEDTLYSGSIIKRGEVDAFVYGTGKNTFFGRAAELVDSTENTGHFQKMLLKIGDFLIASAILLVILIIIVSVVRGVDLLKTLQFALILTVASIPVAMPTVLSVTMAVGARLLAKKGAIVSRLTAIEELSGLNVICSDKTGTLTKNTLTLGKIFAIDNTPEDNVLEMAALASRKEDEDPIDLAILNGCDGKKLEGYAVSSFTPFDPVIKRTEASITTKDNTAYKVTKGAVQVILAISENKSAVMDSSTKAIEAFASKGYRSIGVAKTDTEGKWQFLGIIPLFDPLRDDAAQTIKDAQDLGCQVKMITGDQLAIAKETASQLHLSGQITDASLFDETNGVDPETFRDTVEKTSCFAQVFPKHKFTIVDVLQKRGHLVGMTGDGVNDAPALKKANVGIAVSGATDAARAAADLVFKAPGLQLIINALKESRCIFQRMKSYAIYRISETIQILIFMTLSILFFNFYPVTAVMIVLLAILNDGAILSISYDRVEYSTHPDRWNMPFMLGISTCIGLLAVISTFGLFYYLKQVTNIPEDHIQTLIYLQLSIGGHLTIFITRTRRFFFSHAPSPILIIAVFGTQILATFLGVYGIFMPSVGWKLALSIWVYCICWFFIMDLWKVLLYAAADMTKSTLAKYSLRK